MAERIPCINLRCRRTADPAKMNGSAEMVCAKCFRSLPVSIRRRDRQLRRRWRLVKRLGAKGTEHRRRGRKFGQPDRGVPQALSMGEKMRRIWNAHWERLRAYFAAPEKPIGLDAFLAEVWL